MLRATFSVSLVLENFIVTNARVGQQTDYDKLTLEVWTNGAVRPKLTSRRK